MNCNPPGSSVHGILQARIWILEWVAIPFFTRSSWPRDWVQVFCIAGRFFTIWATREAPCLKEGYKFSLMTASSSYLQVEESHQTLITLETAEVEMLADWESQDTDREESHVTEIRQDPVRLLSTVWREQTPAFMTFAESQRADSNNC